MNSLAEDVIRLLLEYLSDEDQIQMMDSSKVYQRVKKAIRKVNLDWEKVKRYRDDEQYRIKLLSLIDNVGKQLEIKGEGIMLWENETFSFFHFLHLKKTCSSVLFKLLSIHDNLRITTIDVSYPDDAIKEGDSLYRMCEEGRVQNLHLFNFYYSHNFSFPYFPNIESLAFINKKPGSTVRVDLPELYTAHLQKLHFYQCSDIDVSCLGMIPDLQIEYCTNVQGISYLKNNRKIKIRFSSTDYQTDLNFSKSFMNSERIELSLMTNKIFQIDTSVWSKVQMLSLKGYDSKYAQGFTNVCIPSSVRRCILRGYFIEVINWQPFTSQLTELKLSNTERIVSLKGLGLDTIPILTLEWLHNLTTLDGLGRRSSKVTVKECHSIKDFSALRSVDTVTIENCKGFEDISQVNEVRVLELNHISCVLKNLDSLSDTTYILSLRMENFAHFYSPTLAKIPHLIIKSFNSERFKKYLANGGRLDNPCITICGLKTDIIGFNGVSCEYDRIEIGEEDYFYRIRFLKKSF